MTKSIEELEAELEELKNNSWWRQLYVAMAQVVVVIGSLIGIVEFWVTPNMAVMINDEMDAAAAANPVAEQLAILRSDVTALHDRVGNNSGRIGVNRAGVSTVIKAVNAKLVNSNRSYAHSLATLRFMLKFMETHEVRIPKSMYEAKHTFDSVEATKALIAEGESIIEEATKRTKAARIERAEVKAADAAKQGAQQAADAELLNRKKSK